ncbi:MAG: hypothetical protein UHT92_09505, partial [Prevotella sp.]|nr:hypothetical protein [Prevotella sp.]
LTWNIIGYKRDLINQALTLAALSFLFAFFHSFGGYAEGIADWEGIKDSAEINTIMIAILFILNASNILFTTRTRNEFVNFMMLPATHAEKFCSNFIFQTVIRFVCMIAAIMLADALQAVISLIITHDAYSLTLATANVLYKNMTGLEGLQNIAGALGLHSTFILGGCFFRKRQTLFTLLAWIGIPLLIAIVVGVVGYGVVSLADKLNYSITVEIIPEWEKYADIAGTVINMAWATLCYWLSYRIFRRLQFINNRFFN